MAELPTILEQHRAAIEALCRQFGVLRLEVIGSAATGAFDPQRSDVDFLVEFQPQPPGGLFRCFFDLLEQLEKLLGRRVDLVTPGSIRNRFLLAAVNRARVPLYAA